MTPEELAKKLEEKISIIDSLNFEHKDDRSPLTTLSSLLNVSFRILNYRHHTEWDNALELLSIAGNIEEWTKEKNALKITLEKIIAELRNVPISEFQISDEIVNKIQSKKLKTLVQEFNREVINSITNPNSIALLVRTILLLLIREKTKGTADEKNFSMSGNTRLSDFLRESLKLLDNIFDKQTKKHLGNLIVLKTSLDDVAHAESTYFDSSEDLKLFLMEVKRVFMGSYPDD